jgi:methionyl-tRNA formyltransferase
MEQAKFRALGDGADVENAMSLRVAFFGLPLAALLLERDGHEIVSVGLSRTDAVGYRRARRVFGSRLSIKPDVRHPRTREALVAAAPDLVVSWFWTTLLPMSLVDVAPLGGIGVHPSLLPRHRGPDPYYWAIASGDEVTGVTAHRIAAAYDTGELLGQRSLSIAPTWNAWNLARALDRPSLALLRETVHAFARGEPPASKPQDDALATEAPAPTEESMEIVWDRPTSEILRQIRALGPTPGAYFAFEDEVITVSAARAAHRVPKVLLPGEACVTDEGAVIRTADGGIVLLAGEVDEEPVDADTLAVLFAGDVVQ